MRDMSVKINSSGRSNGLFTSSVPEFPCRPLGLPAGVVNLTCQRQPNLQLLSRKGTTAKVIFTTLKALFLKMAEFQCLYSIYANPELLFRVCVKSIG